MAIFRESGLKDDVTIANLQDACLKLVVLARARARELQVDQQVERAQQPLSAKTAIPTTKSKPKGNARTDPDGCKNGENCQYALHIPVPMGSVCAVAQSRTISRLVPVPRRQQSSRSSSAKPAPKKTYAKPKGKAVDAQTSN